MAGKLMHAVHYTSCGGGPSDLKYVEVPLPTPKKDEVLIKVEAASLSPIDWKIQQGVLKPMFPRELPQIPGTDVAGEVVQVGSGVKNVKAGDKVVAMLSFANGGGLAEFVVAKANLTVPRPPEVSAAEGAGLPAAGLMAHQALTDSAGIKLDGSGKPTNILITGASDGVGHYAVQLAKLGNTHITATCAPEHIDFVKTLGADEVVDETTPDGQALKSPSGKKYDIVIHCAAPTSWSTFEPNLASNAKIFDVNPTPSAIKTYALKKLTFNKKQLIPVLLSGKAENLDFLVKLVKEGKLKTVIDSTYSMSKPEDAWAKNADNKVIGKIIVEP
uniref:Enoyl reductase (ER) domain-containing protein n=1 Tax=Fagus sylvatica TaxID=28930 RepID=A0A2N9HSS9_FAGSY